MSEPPKPPADPFDAPTLIPGSQPSPLGEATTIAPVLTPPPAALSDATTAAGAVLAPEPGFAASVLGPGSLLGQRYEILQALGEGGMGAVYKARDRELDRLVALKVIRAELARDPGIIQRFKQELILARQITHRNVVRIFDLGEADGIKFITMEYIEGHDVCSLLKQKKRFAPSEAAGIVQQVCLALQAAHSEGVIHRDLKPQNIMQDGNGRIVVMDFGVARTFESGGMTQTGMLMGTIEYMSPEQGMGQELDQRSDLFTLGLIFYELLTGEVPFKADTPLASLLKRTQEKAVPASRLDRQIPEVLSKIVSRCLERDPKLRYGSAGELLAELEAWQGKSAASSIQLPAVRAWGADLPWVPMSIGVVILALAVSGYLLRDKLFGGRAGTTAGGPVISLAVLPFRNASGDASMDWVGVSVAELLSSDVGESAQLRVISPDRVHQVLHDLQIGAEGAPDDSTLRRLADFSNADQVITGQYIKLGEQLRFEATLHDLKHQHVTSVHADAPSQAQLLATVDELAHSIQQGLALSSGAVRDLRATAFTPSTHSVGALRDYTQGLERLRESDFPGAQKAFEASVQQDSGFALAYSKLAHAFAEQGYDNRAEEFSRRAVELSDKLPQREKFLIMANHNRIIRDPEKAIEIYENLARLSPDDTDVQFALGDLYSQTGAYDKAREHFERVLKRDPKSVDGLVGIGQVETLRLDPQNAIEYLNRALALSIQLGNEAKRAQVLQTVAVAYRQLNKPDDALRYAQESLGIYRRLQQKKGTAIALRTAAQTEASLGQPAKALSDFQEAISLQRDIADNRGLGDTLNNLGQFYNDAGKWDDALKAFKESLQIERNLGDKTYEAVALNNIGVVYSAKGQYDDAQSYYEQALHILEQLTMPVDTADTLHNLADVATYMGNNDKALAYYLRGLELRRKAADKRGAAIDSYGMAVSFGYMGRFGAAAKALEEAVKTFNDLQERGFWTAEILARYGNALNQRGLTDQAQAQLDKAEALARGLKNADLTAEILNYRGDSQFYRGDFKRARGFYQQAVQQSMNSSDRNLALSAKLSLAKANLELGAGSAVTRQLQTLAHDADGLGLKYLSVAAATSLADGLVRQHSYAAAREELERSLDKSEKFGFRALQARIHYLLGVDLRALGNEQEASRHAGQAREILDQLQKEAGDTISKRSDFSAIRKS